MKKILTFIPIIFICLTLSSCKNNKIEILFEDAIVEYDGNPHSIVPKNITNEMDLDYSDSEYNDYLVNEIAEFTDVGEYRITCLISENNKEIATYEAILKIVPKQAFIIVDDVIKENGVFPPLTYTVQGVLPNDELGEYLNFSSDNRINYYWENKNYNVTVVGGNIKTVGTIIDTIEEYGYGYDNDGISAADPSLAPFAFTNSNFFENKTITSISFRFAGYQMVWDDESKSYVVNGDLKLPIYVINSDLSTKREECNENNGTKYVIDVSTYLEGKDEGDIITIEGLNIYVGVGQTLAFGDENMGFYLSFASKVDNKDFSKYLISRNIFDDKLQGMRTLLVKIEGTY